MIKSIKIIIIISMLVLLFDSAYAATNSPPPTQNRAAAAKSKEGWYKTKWGMTIDEIRTVLKDEIKEIVPENMREYATDFTYTIPVFEKGGYTYDVYIAFDTQKRLNAVLVRLRDGQNYHKCFLDLENDTKKKFGNPSPLKKIDYHRTTQGKTLEWITKDTIIRLNYVTLGSSNKATNILYKSRGDTEINK
jgi:hypothetical protein